METVYEINEIITSLMDLSGVGICFYDLTDFFRWASGGRRELSGHYCELCINARLLKNGRESCDRSDRMEAVRMAEELHEPFFYRCHMGLCELIVPIGAEDRLVGVVFLGQCRIEGEDIAAKVGAAAGRLGGTPAQFEAMYASLPVISRENLLSMGKIVQAYFKNLALTERIFPKGGSVLGEKHAPLCERIRVYIEMSYMHDISPGRISEKFFVNSAYMARDFRANMGCTVTEYINRTRIRHACRLLANTHVSIGSIAMNVGYSDTNYFTRVFTKQLGIPPSVWRERNNSTR